MRELHRLPRIDGRQQDFEDVLRPAQTRHPGCRGDGHLRVRIDLYPGRPQLEQRALGRGDQFGRLPQPGGDGDRGGFVRGQLDGA